MASISIGRTGARTERPEDPARAARNVRHTSRPLDAPVRILYGRTLAAARLALVATHLASLAILIAAFPVRRAQLQQTVLDLSPAQLLVLKELGVAYDQHPALVQAVEIAVQAAFVLVALLLFARRSRDLSAIVTSAGLSTFVVWICPSVDLLAAAQPLWQVPSATVQSLGTVLALAFLLVFPDGRFVPRWSVVLLAGWSIWALGWVLFPGTILDVSDPFRLPLPVFFLRISVWIAGLGAQVYRFARVATPVQKRQTKLVLLALSFALGGYSVFGLQRFAVPVLYEPLFAGVVFDLVGVPLFLFALLLVPFAFAISALRYRLWEIELVVNRALIYIALTAVLGGLYTASITLSQRLFIAVTGEKSDAAIVLTTLVVASVFTQVRSSLQTLVEHRVKAAPDPAAGMRELEQRVRSFVEVTSVVELTRKVLEESLRAFGASGGAVYLRQNGQFQVQHVQGNWTQEEGMGAWLTSGDRCHGWVALGPRQSGDDYSPQQQSLFSDVVGEVARAIEILEGAKSPGGPGRATSDLPMANMYLPVPTPVAAVPPAPPICAT